MSYYKKQIQQSQSSGGKSKKPSHVTGSFTVEKCLCGPVQLMMSDTKEFAFRITTPKRSYFLVAANAQEFEIWKEKIKLNGGKWHDEKATVLIKEDGSIQIQSNAPLRTISKNQISRRRNSGTEISLPIEKKVNFIPIEIEKEANKFEEKEDMTFFFNKKTGIDFVDIHKGFNKEIKQKSSSPNDAAIHLEAKKTNSFEDTSDKVFNQSDEVDLTEQEDYSSSEVNHTIEELIPSLTLEEKKIPKASDEEIGTFFIGRNSVDMKIITKEEKDKEPKEEVEFPTFVLHRGLDVELK